MLFQFGARFNAAQIGVTLERFGIIDIILPFILVFTVVFAVLQKSGILGESDKAKKFNVVLALVMGLLFVAPHVTGRYRQWGFDPVEVVNQAIPQVSVLAVAIILMLVLLGLVGLHEKSALSWITGFVSVIFLVGIFAKAAGFLDYYWLDFLNDPDLQALLVIILVFGLIVRFITSDDKGEENKGGIFNFLEELFKKRE